MKAVVVPSQGAPMEIRDNLNIPEPGDDQILVKSVYTAVNPVETFLIDFGVLVLSWPLVPGCDAGGVVAKVGKNAVSALGESFKEGDRVCGCTRLGSPGYSTFQEYFLMDSKLAIPVPKKLNLAEACTVGVASYTAALAVFNDLNVPIPDPKNLPAPKDEWALVLGGASSVGKMSIQILKVCGYKVIATASESSFGVLKSTGADECVNYKQDQDAIISDVVKKTGGKMYRIFDAVGKYIPFSVPMFQAIKGTDKWFTGTDDWDPRPKDESFHSGAVSLGPIGRPDAKKVNADVESYIPFLYAMLESGKLTPSASILIGKPGLEAIPEAYAFQKAGKAGNKKVIVNIADV